MKNEEMIEKAAEYAACLFQEDCSGHDADHTLRVWRTACRIAEAEGADLLTVSLAALLHDADDEKLFPDTAADKGHARSFLSSCGATEELTQKVLTAIGEVSYRGTDSVVPSSMEGKCVQDADRLDAMGAIGIARCFAYGGSRGRKIYDPAEPPVYGLDGEGYRNRKSHSVNHIREKLLTLKDLMTTAEGKRIAEERHAYLEGFLTEFLAEWEGDR